MRIVIIGIGKVGYTLADKLSAENHDITLIDIDALALARAESNFDVMCVRGSGTSLAVLAEARVEEASLLISVTNSDEINMICCLLGKKLGAKHTIARVRNPEYEAEHDLLIDGLGLDVAINPEYLAAEEISRLLQFPWAASVETFARGKVGLVGLRVSPDDLFVGNTILEIAKKLPARVLFCTVEREGDVFIPNGGSVLQAGDKLHVIGETRDLAQLAKMLNKNIQKIQRVMLIGGGRIAFYLAEMIRHSGIYTKIIEMDEKRCAVLNEGLPDALIINADGTDQEILESENIRDMDAFVTITGRDEENVFNSMFAMRCKVPKVITKINRANYSAMLQDLGIDSVIIPRESTASYILRHVRVLNNEKGSFIETLYRLGQGRVEAIEFSDSHAKALEGIPLKKLTLKPGVLVASIMRGRKIIIPRGDDSIQDGDNVIVISKEHMLSDLNDIAKWD